MIDSHWSGGIRKILILSSYGGSLVRFRSDLIFELLGRGYDVTACAPDLDAEMRKPLEEQGCQFRRVHFDRTGLSLLRDSVTLVSLWKLFREEKPDLLVAYLIKSVIYGGIAARVAGVPRFTALITGLGFGFGGQGLARRLLTKFLARLYRTGLGGAQRVIFQNPDDRDLFVSLEICTSQQARVVNGSGVKLETFPVTPVPDKPVFLMIARLLVEKGVRDYVEAARRVKASHPEARFLLVGWRDSARASITAKELAEWSAEGTIEYLGRLADVRETISASQVYVLPSYREGTPRTVLECMSMGRAIITTDAPGCRETVIEGVNGHLVPVRDPQALAEAMISFIIDSDKAHRMGVESRRLVEEKYDVRLVNQDMLRFMGLLEESGGRREPN